MKVYIIRHGDKKTGNYYNEYLKHEDPSINEAGVLKAKRLPNYFKGITVSKIIASEYVRTYETALFTAESKGLPILRDKRLNEIDNGSIESMTDEEIKEKYPEFWDDFFSYSKDVRFPEGETGEEVKTRQKDLLEQLILEDEDVLLFCHEGYIRLLLCHLLGLPVYKRHLFHIDMCGITELEYNKENGIWKVNRVNQVVSV